MKAKLETKWRWHIDYSACSVEWCPIPGYTDYFVCGTYQLDKIQQTETAHPQNQNRLGRIYLFRVDQNTTSLAPTQTVETSAILDQKWSHNVIDGYPMLAVVTAEGSLQIHKLVESEGSVGLKLATSVILAGQPLALSVDWSNNKFTSDSPYLVVSDSKGSIVLYNYNSSLTEVQSWKGHEFEGWIAAFNSWDKNLFYSGGDDCVFRSYDARCAEPLATNRSHEAGVTTLTSSAQIEHQLLSGSYDEKIRLWDTRQLKRPTADLSLGGGIWRLKHKPSNDQVILAACMYGGFKVIELKDNEFRMVCDYLEHGSIAYGADWQHGSAAKSVATCSFYDCQLHVSDFEIDEINENL